MARGLVRQQALTLSSFSMKKTNWGRRRRKQRREKKQKTRAVMSKKKIASKKIASMNLLCQLMLAAARLEGSMDDDVDGKHNKEPRGP
jgi:hypothetical protein